MTSARRSPLPVWLLFLPLAASFVLATWALPRQPDRVPVHWNAAGQPDRWGSPVEALFSLPGSILFVTLMIALVGRSQPGAQPVIRVAVFGLGVMALGDVAAQAFAWDSFRITMVTLGLLFLMLGPALRRSDPATLSGPRLSPASQRLAGQAWTGLGAALVLASLFAPATIWITWTLTAGLTVMVLGMTAQARRDRRQRGLKRRVGSVGRSEA